MTEMRDEFFSEEDLDLAAMSDEELSAYWDLWLRQAQITNDLDRHTYSHGVFLEEPVKGNNGERIHPHRSQTVHP
jgi:hypothetical protein